MTMRLLLDTHVALWSVIETSRIPQRVQRMIADPGNEVFISTVSVWELGLKFGIGRSRRPMPSRETLVQNFEIMGYTSLDVSMRHAVAFENLAVAHADPFDRMILTQALTDQLRLVTVDSNLAKYTDTVITW
jgi:PIN domain nuclease of toxin-antitoxin system